MVVLHPCAVLRVFPHISSLCVQLVLLYNPPFPLLLMGVYGYIGIIPPPSGLCMYVPLQEVHPFSCRLGTPPCRQSLFVLLSIPLFHSHPQSSFTATIFYHLVALTWVATNVFLYAYLNNAFPLRPRRMRLPLPAKLAGDLLISPGGDVGVSSSASTALYSHRSISNSQPPRELEGPNCSGRWVTAGF